MNLGRKHWELTSGVCILWQPFAFVYMACRRPSKKPCITKYEISGNEVQYHQHHVYCAHEHGQISVQLKFIQDKKTNENVNGSLTSKSTTPLAVEEPISLLNKVDVPALHENYSDAKTVEPRRREPRVSVSAKLMVLLD